ncbi:MAG: hypothetical protein ACKOX6_16340 [Bdellovibrio sp.]
MLPLLQKHALITTALIATLGLSACGKKTEVFGDQKATAEKKAETPTDTSTPPNSSDSGDSDNNCIESGEVNTNPNTGRNDLGDVITDLPDPTAGGNTCYTPPPASNIPPVRSDSGDPVLPPVVDTELMPVPSSPINGNYNPKDSKNVNTDQHGKRVTGGMTAEGLFYSSSSTDNLLDILRMRNSRGNNSAAAQSVVSAIISTMGSSNSSNVVVTLKIQENGRVKVYNLAGYSGAGANSTIQLEAARSGNGLSTTGQRSVEGTLRCMDYDGGCETALAKIKIGSSTVDVVFRTTNADLYFSLPAAGRSSGNPEFERVQNMALNTIRRIYSDDNRAKTAKMNSWEVVNGRSGFNVSIKTFENELLAFAGPLLIPRSGTAVNVVLAKIGKDSEDALDLLSRQNSSLKLANTMGDARLVANNSLGQVRVSLKMRKRSNYAQDQMEVTFMRRIKPLVELNDRNLK